jgi:hypothetical protein
VEDIKDYKNVIKFFNANDALAIKTTQDVIQNEFLIQNLMFIKTYLRTISDNIKKLKTTGVPLTKSTKVAADSAQNFKSIPETCSQYDNKMQYSFSNKFQLFDNFND